MASSRPFSLFPDLNDPSSSSGPSAPALTHPSLPTLTIEQVMAAQTDIDANHLTLKSCMETVAAVTNLSHRLQNRTSELHRVNAQLNLLQQMYKDARAEICMLKAEKKELKRKTTSMESKEVKRQATCIDQFGVPAYFSFDGRRKVNSFVENTEVGPSKADDKKRKSSATEEPSK